MKNVLAVFTFSLVLFSCQYPKEQDSMTPNWDSKLVYSLPNDSLINGSTYLSVYSQIYSLTGHKTHNLTATISLRNTSREDTIYIEKATYYGTKGEHITDYVDHLIFIRPMGTLEIVIDEIDKDGGTGANFVFDWKTKVATSEPLFEAVMISTSGQQGLSFVTQGKRL